MQNGRIEKSKEGVRSVSCGLCLSLTIAAGLLSLTGNAWNEKCPYPGRRSRAPGRNRRVSRIQSSSGFSHFLEYALLVIQIVAHKIRPAKARPIIRDAIIIAAASLLVTPIVANEMAR